MKFSGNITLLLIAVIGAGLRDAIKTFAGV